LKRSISTRKITILKRLDFGQVKIRAHALRKSNRQKLELKASTQEETQNDERNYNSNNALLRH
jgi:hypothetical protein